MITIYGMALSGNCYKLKLMAELLTIDYQWYEVNIIKGESRTPDFLEKNPNGKVPLMILEDGTCLPESNAGLYYLARDSEFFPKDKLAQAQVLQWMFFEQYTHEPAIAVARFINKFLPENHPRCSELPSLLEKGNQALGIMDQHMGGRDWFVGERATIADIALFAYTHVADGGGFDLSKFPALVNWLERVKALKNFCAM